MNRLILYLSVLHDQGKILLWPGRGGDVLERVAIDRQDIRIRAFFDHPKDARMGFRGPDVTIRSALPALMPENNWSAGADIRFAMFGGAFFVQSDYASRNDFSTNSSNLPLNQTESYNLLNGQPGWTSGSGSWTIHAWARNLENETSQIWNHWSFLGVARGTYTEPRTYGLAVRWNFGAYY